MKAEQSVPLEVPFHPSHPHAVNKVSSQPERHRLRRGQDFPLLKCHTCKQTLLDQLLLLNMYVNILTETVVEAAGTILASISLDIQVAH